MTKHSERPKPSSTVSRRQEETHSLKNENSNVRRVEKSQPKSVSASNQTPTAARSPPECSHETLFVKLSISPVRHTATAVNQSKRTNQTPNNQATKQKTFDGPTSMQNNSISSRKRDHMKADGVSSPEHGCRTSKKSTATVKSPATTVTPVKISNSERKPEHVIQNEPETQQNTPPTSPPVSPRVNQSLKPPSDDDGESISVLQQQQQQQQQQRVNNGNSNVPDNMQHQSEFPKFSAQSTALSPPSNLHAKLFPHLPTHYVHPPLISPSWLGERLKRLSTEILQYSTAMKSATGEQKTYHEIICQEIQQLVSSRWDQGKAELFGSVITGLALPYSDVDIVVTGVQPLPEINASPLQLLSTIIRSQPWFISLQLIESALIPVIKLVARIESAVLHVDISFDLSQYSASCNVPKHYGVQATELVKQFIQQYPNLIPLTLITKQILWERGLNQAYTGGLSSYCLVLMIVSFLQQFHSGKNAEASNLGEILVDLLSFYGHRFQYHAVGISVRRRPPFFCLLTPSPTAIWVENPFDCKQNVGRCTFNIHHICYAFNDAVAALLAPFESPTLLERILYYLPKDFVILAAQSEHVASHVHSPLHASSENLQNSVAQKPTEVN